MCQDAYQLLHDSCSADRTGLPPPAPRGHLLTTITGSQSDHAAVEHKRVDCLVKSIRILTGDEDFDILRSDCFHHKGGLFAAAAQNADSKVRFLTHVHTHGGIHNKCYNSRTHTLTLQIVQNKIGEDLDTSIREFKTSNILDQFQRQLALVFSPLEGYAFGSANFPQWFQQKFPGVCLATMDRQVRTIQIHQYLIMIIKLLLCLHHRWATATVSFCATRWYIMPCSTSTESS